MTAAAQFPVDVSVVVVSMNQPENLGRCLDSLQRHTQRVRYEIWVVAYLYSPENLAWLRARHPAVNIIESREIRGFAENNNLALERARGEFCFVVNDDTVMEMPVVDRLHESFQKEPRADFISPKILFMDGSVQYCGDVPHTMRHWLLFEFKLRRPDRMKSPWVNGQGIFRTYNLLGAAFMVRTSVLRELGYFDETYFFAPEDTALSTLANQRGFACYVNADVQIHHLHAATLGRHALATMLAMQRGQTIFHSRNSVFRWLIYATAMFLLDAGKSLYWGWRSRAPDHALRRRIWRTAMLAAFSRKTPKELFLRHYKPAAGKLPEEASSDDARKVWS